MAQQGLIREFHLTATPAQWEATADQPIEIWTYNQQVPGPEIRVTEGEFIRVFVENQLPEPTTIHWHGLPVPNAMDGVPGLTQEPIPPGGRFVYEFPAWPAGTYIYHSHEGYQLDQGLYGALIIEPKEEPRSYDREYVLVLDDWANIDGGGPAQARAGNVRRPMGMGRGMMRGRRTSSNAPLLEPLYDLYILNGREAQLSEPFTVRRGERIRLRIGNLGSATHFTLRLAGHPLLITHADGRPVAPIEVDVLRVGMGERYDVEFVANHPGIWELYTLDDGTGIGPQRLGIVRYMDTGRSQVSPDNLSRRFRRNTYAMLTALPEAEADLVPLDHRPPERMFNQVLSGGMMGSPYWTINGRIHPDSELLTIQRGELIRIHYLNRSMMPHPMHLHGHFFEVLGSGNGGSRLRKDTLIVEPMGGATIEFVADNPGRWFHHCHNLYHAMAGMANEVRYQV